MTEDGEWCVVANVKPEAFGRATSPGTRHFVAGTKVYCVDWYWGMGGESGRVLGRHRRSRRMVLLATRTDQFTNWRAKLVFHPYVIRVLRTHRTSISREKCEQIAAGWARYAPPIEDLHERAEILASALRLITDDPLGRELAAAATAVLGNPEPTTAADVFVLGDWLEERGARLDLDQLCTTLRRRRDNAGT